MANIVIKINELLAMSEGNVIVNCSAMCDDAAQTAVSFTATEAASALAATWNETIKDAAIAAAAGAGVTVGPLDKKTLLGGGVGL